MMDEVARYNRERWEELAKEGTMYSRPALELDETSARKMVDLQGVMGDPTGLDVLCLACGGGQQSAAFALLGARVTVLDFCETQLERDRETARHYGMEVRTVLGDMRDLSCFEDDSFDVVWQAHSINFVPDVGGVFDEVVRVLRGGGLYRLHFTNPLAHGLSEKWNGEGYTISDPYVEGSELVWGDAYWDVKDEKGKVKRVKGPREFRHLLSTLVNGLVERGLVILGLWEDPSGDRAAKPGSWDHFTSVAPPWVTLWTVLRPEALEAPPPQRTDTVQP